VERRCGFDVIVQMNVEWRRWEKEEAVGSKNED